VIFQFIVLFFIFLLLNFAFFASEPFAEKKMTTVGIRQPDKISEKED